MPPSIPLYEEKRKLFLQFHQPLARVRHGALFCFTHAVVNRSP